MFKSRAPKGSQSRKAPTTLSFLANDDNDDAEEETVTIKRSKASQSMSLKKPTAINISNSSSHRGETF
jgi:hypothetical protein